MADSASLTLDDRRVLHALQIDGRASFARIAAVLGMPERTVSRRYHRLRSGLALRVVAVTRPEPAGHEDWFLHVTPRRDSVDTVTRLLANRDDTSWLAPLAGDGGLGCILRSAMPAEGRASELDHIRRNPLVEAVTARRLLTPIAGVGGWPGRIADLSPAEREAMALGKPAPEAGKPPAGVPLSDEDSRLIRLLAMDGRMSFARLSRASGMPESTVRRRVSELTSGGLLMFEVEVDARLYGRHVGVICWLDVRPDALGAVAAALGSHTEIAFAATTTGTAAVLAILELADAAHLHRYLVDRLGALAGVQRVQTEIITRWVKRAGPLIVPPV